MRKNSEEEIKIRKATKAAIEAALELACPIPQYFADELTRQGFPVTRQLVTRYMGAVGFKFDHKKGLWIRGGKGRKG